MSVRSANPAFSEATFQKYGNGAAGIAKPMTVEGTVNKTLILLLLAVLTASITWSQVLTPGGLDLALPLAGLGFIGGFIVALVTIFKPNVSGYTAPIYALLEGLGLGAVSCMFNMRYPGIATQAVGLTFSVLIAMLLAYRFGVIKVTDKFRMGVIAATGGIFLFSMVAMVMSMFGAQGPSNLLWYSHSPLAIGISLLVVVIAAMNLALDFDQIERGVATRMPAFMEWYCGFGLMVTLVWLYMRILRLLGQLRGR